FSGGVVVDAQGWQPLGFAKRTVYSHKSREGLPLYRPPPGAVKQTRPAGGPAPGAVQSLGMNALVVVASGWNPAYAGCYGNAWVETPHLDRLAAEGVVFDNHFATDPDPAGAGFALRTGRYLFPGMQPSAPPPYGFISDL